MGLVCSQGTNQGDLSNAWYHLHFLHESEDGSKKYFARRCIQGIEMARHGERSCRLTPRISDTLLRDVPWYFIHFAFGACGC